MITLGLPCPHCNSPTMAHCPDAHCKWSRCPRCMSYGFPDGNMVKWNRADYINPYTLSDVMTAAPERKFPDWLEEAYGTDRNTESQ